jgi:hypothetical protein
MKGKNLVMIFVFILLGMGIVKATEAFQIIYGRIGDNFGYAVQQTFDRGYIITGYTEGINGGEDVYLIKTDSTGDTLWTKSYGGTGDDEGYSVQQTTDTGYIIVGRTNSFDSVNYHIYLIKTNSMGDTLWTRTYGGINWEEGYSVQQTTDGGYIFVGYTGSFGDIINHSADVYLIKTDSIGDTLWTKTYGGTQGDVGYSVQQTTDGGYIITGETISFGWASSLDTVRHVYLIKTNAFGDTLWTKIYGGNGSVGEQGNSVKQTTDGGYIILGVTNSFDSVFNEIYLIKTDANGDTLWTKIYGGNGPVWGYSVQQTTDGGYIISGYIDIADSGLIDAYLIKTNPIGDTLWTRSYKGNNEHSYGYYVHQTTDGGYIIVGQSYYLSYGYMLYLVKTDANGYSGCNQDQTKINVISPPTQVGNTHTHVSNGCIITSPPTVVNSGGIIKVYCRNDDEGINTITSPSPSPSLLLSPNPFTTTTTLTLQGTYHNPSLFIYNLLGQEVRSIPIGTNTQLTINRERLASGMYFYKLIDENKEVIGIGKMVVE